VACSKPAEGASRQGQPWKAGRAESQSSAVVHNYCNTRRCDRNWNTCSPTPACQPASPAHKVFACEGPQGDVLPLLQVPRAPVVAQHITKDGVGCAPHRDGRPQLVAAADQAALQPGHEWAACGHDPPKIASSHSPYWLQNPQRECPASCPSSSPFPVHNRACRWVGRQAAPPLPPRADAPAPRAAALRCQTPQLRRRDRGTPPVGAACRGHINALQEACACVPACLLAPATASPLQPSVSRPARPPARLATHQLGCSALSLPRNMVPTFVACSREA
jgi:hypothetical protein